MAQDQKILELNSSRWTEITNGDVTYVSFMVLSGDIYVRGTVGSVRPDASTLGWFYSAEPVPTGELNRKITDMFTASGVNRVWARGATGPAVVQVDHA